MDTDICRWISEFVMRNTAAQDHVIKKLLRALPVSGADSRFKKTALLRTIQAEISDASLTETTLDNLEVMEELDRDDGTEISNALTAAYRAVAVECTVKYLAGSGDRHGKYFEAVKRVWRGRIGGLERSGRSELVTGELRRWGDDVEAAVWDAKVARRLLKVNTRNEALEAVRVYLGEAWALMGPTFLQSAAAVAEPDGVQWSGASAGDLAVKNAVNRVEEVAGKKTKVNQVEEVAMHTPCVGELAGKTINQVEEVGAKKTPNAGQDVGELANRLVANSRNVVELEAKRVNQVEELAANMLNVVESDADMVNRVQKVGANMPNVVELAAKTANWVAANMPNVVELEMETVNLAEELVGNTSNVSQDVGELSGETANQVALNMPCVGELAGKTMNRVEEVGAKNTPNAGQDVGELTAKMANKVVANSQNVVELEVERVSRVEELAANMTNVVESDVEMVNCVEKVAANMPNVVELASKTGNRVAATMQNVIELEMETVNLVEELVGNTSNVSRDVGELSLETANQVGSNTPNVGQDVGVSSRPELREGEGRELVALQSGTWDLIVRDRAAAGRVDEIQKGVELPRRKHAVCHKRSKGGVKITDTEEMDIDVSCSKYDSLLSPEVNKVQEALKSSSLELRAVVKDPLPDALRLAESVISNMVSKDKQHEPSVENQGGKDINAPNPSVNTGDEPAQTNDSNCGNQSCSHQSNARPPGLMERNSTARAYEVSISHGYIRKGIVNSTQSASSLINSTRNALSSGVLVAHMSAHWDDSIDDSPEGMTNDASRLHLPSPKRKLVSPLKKHEVTKFARRRQIKRWSLLEEDTLRTAVQKYGKGNWKLILNCYRDFFEERTEVDLKDKWRNMSRY